MPFEPALSERAQGNFKLSEDIRSAFIRAARSNQTRLAMEYLVDILDNLITYTESLETRIETLNAKLDGQSTEQTEEAVPAPAPAPRKPRAKKAAAKPKVEPVAEVAPEPETEDGE